MSDIASAQRYKRIGLGFSIAVPIGVAGGLIGLGGAEFRLPVLAGPLQFTPRRAVPINLAISLVTLAAALVVRARPHQWAQLATYSPVIFTLIVTAMLSAFFGATWTSRISNALLRRVILIVLLAIGIALILEALLPEEPSGFIPSGLGWRIFAGIFFGIAIGLFSSVLGVAGGELIIPALVFAYGMDIKLAGTASLLISLPTVLVGVMRYHNRGSYSSRQDFSETILPLGTGSIIGAVAGGLLVGFVATDVLKIFLGLILCFSAWRIFE